MSFLSKALSSDGTSEDTSCSSSPSFFLSLCSCKLPAAMHYVGAAFADELGSRVSLLRGSLLQSEALRSCLSLGSPTCGTFCHHSPGGICTLSSYDYLLRTCHVLLSRTSSSRETCTRCQDCFRHSLSCSCLKTMRRKKGGNGERPAASF